MKSCLKFVPVLFAVFFALGSVSVQEASAQGPIIKRMRERLNGGKPLLPFIADDDESDKKPKKDAKKPTPAKKPKKGTKTPTPAKRPKADSNTKSAVEKQREGAKGFGMIIREVGEDFVIGSVDPKGNAAAEGLRRGDVIVEIGGAPIQVVEEFEAIAKAMRGGDRVEFAFSRRGGKPQTVNVQFGEPEPIDEDEEAPELAPEMEALPAITRRRITDRYEPSVDNGLKSVYEGKTGSSSLLTPAKRPNRVESLEELDFPALEGGK